MICIEKATLTAFGKFHNKKISFGEGLQIFYGPNEIGKSTLQLFFRVMLYGVPNQRKSMNVVLRDRERMIPWGEKYAEGMLTLMVDGKRIEIYRRFGKTPAGDRMEILDGWTGEPLPQYQGEELGIQLFGVSAEVFEKTFWLRQDSAFPVGRDEELGRRLMNLKDTGEEDISADVCIQALEQEKKSLRAKDKRGTPGLLDQLYQRREEKVQERFMLLSEMAQRKAAQKRRDAAEKKITVAQATAKELKRLEEAQKKLRLSEGRRSKWQEAERLQALILRAKEEDSYVKFCHLTEETVNKAEFTKRKLETLDQTAQIGYDKTVYENHSLILTQKKRKSMMLFGVGAGALLTSLVLGVLRIPFWQFILLLGALSSIVFAGFGFVLYKNAVAELSNLQQEQAQSEQEKKKLENEIAVLQKELMDILTVYQCETVEELREGMELCRKVSLEVESYQRAKTMLLVGEDMQKLQKEMTEIGELTLADKELLMRDIGEQIRINQKCQMEALSEMKELEGKLSYVYHGGRNPADVQAEIDQIDREIAENEEKLKAITLAAEVFQRVYEVRKSDFTPKLNEKVNAFLAILMEGTQRSVRISDTYRMRINEQVQSALKEAEYFSCGTYEQIYFALRLALGSMIGNGDEPLFLDDFLVSFDDIRAQKTIELLQNLGKSRQIILFTCHSRIKEYGEKLSININDLEEEIKDVS